ncbi:MAG: fibronectin type III domain-containing protein [Elusimicrobia bacterium]|nr:fibronectin type III domain-containing protein [Elusimicrobiota bacterium]
MLITIDPTGGKYTSLKIDSSGNSHISYFATNSLKYAKWDGVSWTTYTIDSGGVVGMWSSLALDPSGNPSISYFDSTKGDLKLARWNGINWSTQTIDSNGTVGEYSSLAIDGSGTPSVSFSDSSKRQLKYARWNVAFWDIQVVENNYAVYSSLALDGLGNPVIAYHSFLDLKVATYDGSVWSTTIVRKFSGDYSSLAIGTDGVFHVSYGDFGLYYSSYDSLGPPSNVTAVAGTDNIIWSWLDNSEVEVGYRVLNYADGTPLSPDLPANTTFWHQIGLKPNDYYNVVVQAFNSKATSNPRVHARQLTLAVPPTFTTITSATINSASLSWSPANNSPNTNYRMESSRDAINFSEVYFGTSTVAVASGLQDYTTYYFRVRARNHDWIYTTYDTIVSTRLPPVAPVAPGAGKLNSRSDSSIVWTWTDNSSKEAGYRILRAGDLGPLSPDLIANTTYWTQTGLTPNTSHQVIVQAFNYSGVANSLLSPIYYTLPVTPTDAVITSSTISSASLSWSPSTNPPGTNYQLSKSLDATNFLSVYVGTGTMATATSLIDNTTYYFRVKAFTSDWTGSSSDTTVSHRLPPSTPNPSGKPALISRSSSTLVWSWTDNSSKEAGYRVLRAGDLSPLSPELIANTTYWYQTGLTPNTSYQILVQAFNVSGFANSNLSSIYYTLAAPPTGLTVSSSTISSASVSWSSNSNPLGTNYRLEKSPDGTNFSLIYLGTSTTAAALNLTDNATYYFRVQSINTESIKTPFDTQVSFFLPISPPSSPGKPNLTNRSTTEIVWSWADNNSKESGFRVLRAEDLIPLSPDLLANVTTWTQSGLTPNTSSQVMVQAFNASGVANSPLSTTVYSLTLPPGNPSVVSSSGTSVQMSWSGNGNPAGTEYLIGHSINGVTYVPLSSGTYTSATLTGLPDASTNYFMIQAKNGDGLISQNGEVLSVYLPAAIAPPFATNLQVESRTNASLVWTWDFDSPREDGFRILRASDSLILATLPANTTYWVQEGLSPNTQSQIQVEAFNAIGGAVSKRNYNSWEESTYVNPPTNTVISSVTATTVSLSWDPNGNPDGTYYEGRISTDGINFSNFPLDIWGWGTTEQPLTATGLESNKTYFFRIIARNRGGQKTEPDIVVSTFTPLGPPGMANPYGKESYEGAIEWTWQLQPNAEGVPNLLKGWDLATFNFREFQHLVADGTWNI